jgi:glycerol-3-phosphate dehydrogenase (NAD(P)+)
MARVTVLGTGAWGTTLAQVLCDAGHDVLMWGRNVDVVAEINNSRSNHKFLPGVFLPENLKATEDIGAAFHFGESLVLAIPAQTLRENLRAWKVGFPVDRPVISTLKGDAFLAYIFRLKVTLQAFSSSQAIQNLTLLVHVKSWS